MKPYIIPFERLKNTDVELVGGKNASIGEMISGLASLGVSVPGGFATTSHAYRDFLAQDGLDERIRAPWRRWTSTTSRGLPLSARNSKLDARRAISAEASRGSRKRLAPDGHGRGVRGRGAFRPRRRKICPRHPSPGSKRPSSMCAARSICSSACTRYTPSLFNDRANRLPRTQPLRPQRRSRSRSACSHWFAATWGPPV